MRARRERRGRQWGALIAALSGLASAGGGAALAAAETTGEPELLTDRPDFTETAVVVPLRSLQVEIGLTYANSGDGARVFNAPELLLRYGVARRTEIRLGLPDYVTVRGGGPRISQFGDTYLGIKQQLAPPGAALSLALIPAVTLPTGGRQLTSDRVDPEIALAWSRDLSQTWSVGGILGYARPTEEGRGRDLFFPTVAFGRAIAPRWGTFFEWAAEFPEGEGDVHLLHHGYTYALAADRQLDLHFGVGLTRAAPDFFIGAGYVFRR
jgi:hypothetical protein